MERLFLSYIEIDGRRVNVPKGTPGSISKPLQEPRDLLSMGISPEAVGKAKRKSLNPAEMDTVQFLLWAEEATLQELEEFSQRGGQEEDTPLFPSDPRLGQLFYDGRTKGTWRFNGSWLKIS